MTADYVTVLRAPSAVLLLPDQGFEMSLADPPSRVRLRSRWRDGQMVLRWIAAGMGEARRQFRRVNGYLHLPALRAALEAEVANTVTGPCEDQEEVQAA